MLCAGDVANAGVASCAAGAEFGWYLATCVINAFNFISANHSKIWTQQDDDTKLRSHDTSFFWQISMEAMSKPCATTSRNVTTTTLRKQSMRTRHRTIKPPNPHIHKTSTLMVILTSEKIDTLLDTIQFDHKSFTPLSTTEYGLKNKMSPAQKCSAEEASTGWFLSWLP